MAPETYQLADLTNFIRRVFALNLPKPVWVAAEIGQVDTSRGHCWLSLVQKEAENDQVLAQMEGVIWRNKLLDLQRIYGRKLIKGVLEHGMSVRLKVSTSFHERYGLRLVVEDIDPAHTVGALELRRQQTLERLAAENLLTRNAELPFVVAPQRLAVISSQTAAGLADFKQQLETNPYGYKFRLKIFSAAMQGPKTSPEITARLREIRRNWSDSFDAVVIVRGGGGRTELAAFDDEELCRSVATFPLPVLVGIGHETDDTVLDQVASLSLKTPTATAVFLLERLQMAEGRALELGRSIGQSTQYLLQREQQFLSGVEAQIRQEAMLQLQREQSRLNYLEQRLQVLPLQNLAAAQEKVNHLSDLLAALRPETTLARGYALVSQQGKLLVDPKMLTKELIEIQLRDGKAEVDPK